MYMVDKNEAEIAQNNYEEERRKSQQAGRRH
jgi:hypothetical protein